MNKLKIGKHIRYIRITLGDSMTKFGERIDKNSPIKSGVVSNWENGKQLPNNERLRKIAELGNTTVNEILYGKPIEFLIDNIEIDYKENDLSDINAKGLSFICFECIRDYLDFLSNDLFKTQGKFHLYNYDDIEDYNSLLNHAENNVNIIISNMLQVARYKLEQLESLSKSDFNNIKNSSIIYKKHLNNEEITNDDIINNYDIFRSFKVEEDIEKAKTIDTLNPIANFINKILYYNELISSNKDLDDNTRQEITQFLQGSVHIKQENEQFNKTILKDSYLEKYINDKYLSDLEKINKYLESTKDTSQSEHE